MKPHTVALLMILLACMTTWIVTRRIESSKPAKPSAAIAKELCVCGAICRHGHDCGLRECDGRRK